MVKCKPVHHFGYNGRTVTLRIQDIVFIKSIFNDLLHHGSGCGCQFRRFEYNTISRSYSTYQRCKQQLKRIIPRADDKHHTEWFGNDKTAGWQVKQIGTHTFRAHAAPQMFYCTVQFRKEKTGFSDPAFFRALPQVFVQSFIQFNFILLHCDLQFSELLFTKIMRLRGPRFKIIPQGN